METETTHTVKCKLIKPIKAASFPDGQLATLVKWPLTSVTETHFRKDCVFYNKTEGTAFELTWQSLRHIRSWLSASDVIPAVGTKRGKQQQVQIGPRKFLTQNGWDVTHQTLGRQQCPGSLTTSSLKLFLPHHRKQWRPNCPFHRGYKQMPCSAQSLCKALSCLVEAERSLHQDKEAPLWRWFGVHNCF